MQPQKKLQQSWNPIKTNITSSYAVTNLAVIDVIFTSQFSEGYDLKPKQKQHFMCSA